MEFLAPYFDWIKALHVMAVISWMAGIFYLPRLFVHHAETAPVGSAQSETFKMMEAKLFGVIMQPAMIVTWVCGLLMIMSGLVDWLAPWFIVKFIAVIALTGFNEWCRARLKEFARDENKRPGRYFRIANEVPTVLMIVIVIMVIVKPF